MCFNLHISFKSDRLTKRLEKLADEVKGKSKEEQIKAFDDLMENYIEKSAEFSNYYTYE